MPSMNANWSQNLFEHARRKAVEARLTGSEIMMNRSQFASVIASWLRPGKVLPDDVRMIVSLAMLGPAGAIGPPQHLRDWLLDERVRIPHRGAPPFRGRVLDIVIAFGLSRYKSFWCPPGGAPTPSSQPLAPSTRVGKCQAMPV